MRAFPIVSKTQASDAPAFTWGSLPYLTTFISAVWAAYGASMTAQYQAIMEKLTEMSARLNEALATIAALKEKPGKRWEAIVDKVIWAVLAAVVAFVLGRIGL